MGGLTLRASPRLVFPPQRGVPGSWTQSVPGLKGADPEGATPWGVFPLGLLGSADFPLGVSLGIPGRYSTDFHRFIWTFLGEYSSQ